MQDHIYYAIGDIHGEAKKLTVLHNLIRRLHEQDYPEFDYTLVHLGDYIDRGPDSFDVIKKLMQMEAFGEPKLINLKGNHEAIMLEACRKEMGGSSYRLSKSYYFWLNNGGNKTLESYNKAGFREPPDKHLAWLSDLKSFHWDRVANIIFVHAGVDPTHFPNDGEDRHLWTRSKKFFDTSHWPDGPLSGMTVVHGHTPTESGLPDIDGDFRRINIDTGACYGGDLTAVVLAPNEPPRFISV